MSREIFHGLLEKYNQGLCTEAEKQIVEQWYELLDNQEHVLQPEEYTSIEQRLWSKISQKIAGDEQPEIPKKGIRYLSLKRIIGIAAILCIATTLLLIIRQSTQDRNALFLAEHVNALKTIKNVGTTSLMIGLEDGSKVTLEPKAQLTFPTHFEQSVREVSLAGNGFFLISKNPKRPFLVYNEHIITRVLGTSFSIRLNPKTKEMEVTVKTGKVLVTPNRAIAVAKIPGILKKLNGVTLVPNEKTAFNDGTEKFKTTLADNPVPVVKILGNVKPLSYQFNDVPVRVVISRLVESYGIQINLKDDHLKDYTFTGDLSTLTLYKKLDFLCQSIDANYRIEGTRIIITKN